VRFISWNVNSTTLKDGIVMDGTPTARMCDEVLDAIASPTFDNGAPLSSQTHLANPTPLDWEINPSITQAIYSAQKAAHKLVSSQSLTYLRTSYGKSTIKSFGFSPDSWTQMIIQLAYHHLQGGRSNRNGGTYEAATTRKFKHGRTECIRVVTAEALKWCESMDDEKVGEDAKRGLFREACKVHGRDAREAGNGMGVDRHMFGRIFFLVLTLFKGGLLRVLQQVCGTSFVQANHNPRSTQTRSTSEVVVGY
jgi:carnitine O-acetyltransferase